MKKLFLVTLLAGAFLACSDDDNDGGTTPPLPGFIYEEIVGGELSDDHTAPSGPFTFELGNNSITADQQAEPTVDVDYFTFVIQQGQQLSQILLANYASTSSNPAFIGLQQGNTFSNDASSTTADLLLGGLVYGDSNVDDNILPMMAQLNGAIGFTTPLGAGTYTIWLNQTGANSTARFTFVVTN